MSDLSSAALVKLIRVELRPGHRQAYLESQAVWNRESRRARHPRVDFALSKINP